LFFIPATLISQVIAGDEAVFYTLLIGISIAWAALLVVMGNMIIHNYTIVKELKTLVLTIVAMVIILFILLLFYSIFRQITEFAKSLYTELIYRM
jgi:membrane protein DedA with SNARE-associated domain